MQAHQSIKVNTFFISNLKVLSTHLDPLQILALNEKKGCNIYDISSVNSIFLIQ